jgi:DNA-binding HxlR family transcriptional regulator
MCQVGVKYAQICKLVLEAVPSDIRMRNGAEGRKKMTAEPGCPVQATFNALKGKWKIMIVWHLSFGSKRFAQLRRRLPGVSEKVLVEQLRQLESCGVVSRAATMSKVPRVDYTLTPRGKDLIPPLELLCRWGSRQFNIRPTLVRPAPSARPESPFRLVSPAPEKNGIQRKGPG